MNLFSLNKNNNCQKYVLTIKKFICTDLRRHVCEKIVLFTSKQFVFDYSIAFKKKKNGTIDFENNEFEKMIPVIFYDCKYVRTSHLSWSLVRKVLYCTVQVLKFHPTILY